MPFYFIQSQAGQCANYILMLFKYLRVLLLEFTYSPSRGVPHSPTAQTGEGGSLVLALRVKTVVDVRAATEPILFENIQARRRKGTCVPTGPRRRGSAAGAA